MEDQQAVETQNISSFMVRAANVFSAPGELYTEVAAVPSQTSSWLIPYILSIVMGIIFSISLFNNPALRQQVYEKSQKSMQEAVTSGRMTQEQADQASEAMESGGGGLLLVFGSIGSMLTISIMFFGAALALWLIAKFILKFAGNYKKFLEVYGLASLIGLLGSIITLLLWNTFDTMYATPGGSLLIMDSFDPSNITHTLIASINVFTLWQVGILGLGLSKVSGKSIGIGLGITFTLWVVWVILSSLLGLKLG